MDENRRKLRQVVFEKMLTFLLAGFGLVAALAWNEAIQSLFRQLFGEGGNTLTAKFGYAIIVTLIVTVISFRLGRDIK